MSCIVLPTATKTIVQSRTIATITGTPTAFPLSKRGDGDEKIYNEDNLDLYQNWASMCRNRKDSKNIALIDTGGNESEDNLSLNELWKTVTQTVNCGGGHAITVTKTTIVTATSKSSKPSKESKKSCTGQCWSDYLWRKCKKLFFLNMLFIFFFNRYIW